MTIEDFKKDCETLSAKFVKIDKRSHSIHNLRRTWKLGNNGNHGEGWLPCCRPGIPCTSRIITTLESNASHMRKELIVACTEVKYCLHSTGKDLNSI